AYLDGQRLVNSGIGTSGLFASRQIRSLDAAFGIKRQGKGNPRKTLDGARLAGEMLRRLLADPRLSVEKAAARITKLPGTPGERQLLAYWADHKLDGLQWLARERNAPHPWSSAEKRRLTELFADEPWFIGGATN